jgi:hypothetical protein
VPVPIPASVAEKLKRNSDGKDPDAPLLTKPSGKRWKQSEADARAKPVASLFVRNNKARQQSWR